MTNNQTQRRGATLHKSPEKELEEFLGSKPAWMQRVLQEDFSAFSRDEQIEWINNQDRVSELRPEYERILQLIPTQWKEYRKRLKQSSQLLVQALVPKGTPGRPSKIALAKEAASLHREGKSNPQIATELNKRHGQDTTTSEAVRKLRKRHPDNSLLRF